MLRRLVPSAVPFARRFAPVASTFEWGSPPRSAAVWSSSRRAAASTGPDPPAATAAAIGAAANAASAPSRSGNSAPAGGALTIAYYRAQLDSGRAELKDRFSGQNAFALGKCESFLDMLETGIRRNNLDTCADALENYETIARPLRGVDPESMESLLDNQLTWRDIGLDKEWTKRVVFLKASVDRRRFVRRFVRVREMESCAKVATAVEEASTALLVVTGDSGSGKTLTTIYEAACRHSTDTPAAVLYMTCCKVEELNQLKPSHDLVKLFSTKNPEADPSLEFNYALRSARVQRYIEDNMWNALALSNSSGQLRIRKFTNCDTRLFVVLDEAGDCEAFSRAPSRHHEIMEERLATLMGLAATRVRIIVVGTGANPISYTPGSSVDSYRLVMMGDSKDTLTGQSVIPLSIIHKYRSTAKDLEADLLAAVVPAENKRTSQWWTLGRSLSGNARVAALFVSLIRHVREWACGEDALWSRNTT